MSAMASNPTGVEILGGIDPLEIPIGASKILSLLIQLNGRLFQIGRIPLTKAFVVMVGDVRLVYVSPEYKGYGYVARKLFRKSKRGMTDFDHSLGCAIAKTLGFSYVLLLAVKSAVNRSHGHLERPDITPRGVDLRKHCAPDERITLKMLGITVGGRKDLGRYTTGHGYRRQVTSKELGRIVLALGYGRNDVKAGYLRPVQVRHYNPK